MGPGKSEWESENEESICYKCIEEQREENSEEDEWSLNELPKNEQSKNNQSKNVVACDFCGNSGTGMTIYIDGDLFCNICSDCYNELGAEFYDMY